MFQVIFGICRAVEFLREILKISPWWLFEFTSRSSREKSPNTEFFLVRIFPHSTRKTPYLDSFHAVVRLSFVVFTRLTGQIFALILYLIVTMASCSSILFQHLYNHTVATATLWKWILALISSCETRNHPHELKSISLVEIDWPRCCNYCVMIHKNEGGWSYFFF